MPRVVLWSDAEFPRGCHVTRADPGRSCTMPPGDLPSLRSSRSKQIPPEQTFTDHSSCREVRWHFSGLRAFWPCRFYGPRRSSTSRVDYLDTRGFD